MRRASSAGGSSGTAATLEIDRVVIYRIEDERIAEIWVHDWDQYAYDELFATARYGEPAPSGADPA